MPQDDWIAEMGVDVEKLRHVKESVLSLGPDMSIKDGVDRDGLAGLARGFMLPEVWMDGWRMLGLYVVLYVVCFFINQ
jgi:hypothetical protein